MYVDPRIPSGPRFITDVTRHAIIDELLLREQPFYGRRMNIVDFLNRFIRLRSLHSTDSRYDNLYDDLIQHAVRNNDYSDLEILSRYAQFDACPDRLFGRFLSECVHPLVRDSDSERTELLEIFNGLLRPDAFEMAATSAISGRPLYKLNRTGAVVAASSSLPLNDNLTALFYAHVPGVLKAPSKEEAVAVVPRSGLETNGSKSYDVVLSFAGEQRAYVQSVAASLKLLGISYFYDAENSSFLWGKDLVETLGNVYGGEARYCVMFISEAYARKDWTNIERRSALARALRDRSEYILPVRFDKTQLPWILETTEYVEITDLMTPDRLAALISEKLRDTKGLA